MIDRVLAVDTVADWGRQSCQGREEDGQSYAAIGWPSLFYLLRSRRYSAFRQRPFVDLGCGRGRVLVAAGRVGFSRLLGVEYDAKLASACEKNLAIRSKRQAGLGFEVRQQDAADWAPEEVGLVWMFNPFGAATMRKVARSLAAAAARQRQPICILYCRPTFLDPLLELPSAWLTREARLWGSGQVLAEVWIR